MLSIPLIVGVVDGSDVRVSAMALHSVAADVAAG